MKNLPPESSPNATFATSPVVNCKIPFVLLFSSINAPLISYVCAITSLVTFNNGCTKTKELIVDPGAVSNVPVSGLANHAIKLIGLS